MPVLEPSLSSRCSGQIAHPLWGLEMGGYQFPLLSHCFLESMSACFGNFSSEGQNYPAGCNGFQRKG